MTMPPARPRRIINRAVMAIVGVVLLPVCYIGSVGTLWMGINADLLPRGLTQSEMFNAYVGPAMRYSNSDLPGSKVCECVIVWLADYGQALGVE